MQFIIILGAIGLSIKALSSWLNWLFQDTLNKEENQAPITNRYERRHPDQLWFLPEDNAYLNPKYAPKKLQPRTKAPVKKVPIHTRNRLFGQRK